MTDKIAAMLTKFQTTNYPDIILDLYPFFFFFLLQLLFAQ